MTDVEEEKERLNMIIQKSLGLAREYVSQGENAGMVCHAFVISAVEISREVGADPLDVLNNAFNSAIYAIRENVEFIDDDPFRDADLKLPN